MAKRHAADPVSDNKAGQSSEAASQRFSSPAHTAFNHENISASSGSVSARKSLTPAFNESANLHKSAYQNRSNSSSSAASSTSSLSNVLPSDRYEAAVSHDGEEAPGNDTRSGLHGAKKHPLVPSVLQTGYLMRKSAFLKRWYKQYCVLDRYTLQCFDSEASKLSGSQPNDVLKLEGCSVYDGGQSLTMKAARL